MFPVNMSLDTLFILVYVLYIYMLATVAAHE